MIQVAMFCDIPSCVRYSLLLRSRQVFASLDTSSGLRSLRLSRVLEEREIVHSVGKHWNRAIAEDERSGDYARFVVSKNH